MGQEERVFGVAAVEKCGREGISRKMMEEMVTEFQEIPEKLLEAKERTQAAEEK